MKKPAIPETWVRHETFDFGQRVLEPGVRFSAKVRGGPFTFRSHTVTPAGEWIDCYDSRGHARSIAPERITRVRS